MCAEFSDRCTAKSRDMMDAGSSETPMHAPNYSESLPLKQHCSLSRPYKFRTSAS